jgi:hypothetical protein
MKKDRSRVTLSIGGGILLIATGIIFLLDNLGLITLEWELLIGPLFAFGGLVFLAIFILNTDNWWALIPGLVLIALGTIIFMDNAIAGGGGPWGGAIFLGLLGLAFWLIYLSHQDYWWPVIPGGVLLTLAGVSLLPADDELVGVVFFLGLALTFGLVYLIPKPAGRLTWALYPAGVLALVAILILLGATNLTNFILPLALLILGGLVLYRALVKK